MKQSVQQCRAPHSRSLAPGTAPDLDEARCVSVGATAEPDATPITNRQTIRLTADHNGSTNVPKAG